MHLVGMTQVLLHQPHKRNIGNWVELGLSSTLFVLGVGNIIKAAFQAASYTPKGTNKLLLEYINEIESFAFMWALIAIVTLILLYIILRNLYCKLFQSTSIVRKLFKLEPV